LANHSRGTHRRAAAFAALVACAAAGCGDDICVNVETDISLVCTPDSAAPGLPLLLDVRQSCGLNEARGQACSAVVQGGAVLLTLTEDHCNVGTAVSDTATCTHAVVSCKVPPLGEGDYQITFKGGPGQVLRVRTGGALSCRLPSPPPAP
jgi:hypothetical protein